MAESNGNASALKEVTLESVREFVREYNSKHDEPLPVTPHKGGSWVARINGKRIAFGGWRSDPEGKDAKYQFEFYKRNGRRPEKEPAAAAEKPAKTKGKRKAKAWPHLTVADALDAALTIKKTKVRKRAHDNLRRQAEQLAKHFGPDTPLKNLDALCFEGLLESWEDCSVSTIRAYMRLTKSLFNALTKYPRLKNSLSVPQDFKPWDEIDIPSGTDEKSEKNERDLKDGGKDFTLEEIRLLLDALEGKEVTLFEADENGEPVTHQEKQARPDLRAMVLLGINCAFQGVDIAFLSLKQREENQYCKLDLEAGWVEYPRRKKKTPRKAKLWPETVEAIREAIQFRRPAKCRDDDWLIFLTSTGLPYFRSLDCGTEKEFVGAKFKPILERLGLDRPGRNFSAFRHVAKTHASRAPVSNPGLVSNIITGHTLEGMDSVYVKIRNGVFDQDLEIVADHVRREIWPSKGKPTSVADELAETKAELERLQNQLEALKAST